MTTTGDNERARWTAVDEYAEGSLLRNTDTKLDEALKTALSLARDKDLPPAEVSPLQGQFLATQCQMIGARNVLEVGTLGAYSTIWLASSGPDVHVTTVEVDTRHADVAKQVVAEAGMNDRVNIRLGAATGVLASLRAEVEQGDRPAFDFVFIDADKQNNLNYFDEAVRMCRSKACIVVDNVVRDGALADAEAANYDGKVRGSREVIEAAGVDEKILSATVIQTVGVKGYDGFLMAVVR